MATASKELVFKRHQKIQASVDLPGVPTGTTGKVLYSVGLTWMRYHVLFDNGVDMSSVDATQLEARS